MWNKIISWAIVLLAAIDLNAQSVISPSATSFPQSTSNQVVSGFSVTGFNSTSTLLITIGLVNPPSGTTLRLNTTTGATASTGYNLTSNFTRISFTGTQAFVNNEINSTYTQTTATNAAGVGAFNSVLTYAGTAAFSNGRVYSVVPIVTIQII